MCPVSVGRDDRARVPRHPPHAGRAAEVRAGVGHQHQVLAPARRPRTLRQRRGRRAAHQEVELSPHSPTPLPLLLPTARYQYCMLHAPMLKIILFYYDILKKLFKSSFVSIKRYFN